ncbi:GH18, chitinase CHI18-8 [Trichoderma parareesei]|uniref:chitinase n=1 Tax=Trichoderma parareesei TaxID=858221 RepID=A0A2H3A7Q8_TRIPA|nr:GH18, chitinase CHI18-8 [Trichoderma parareesei]
MRRSIAFWAALGRLASLCGAIRTTYNGQYAEDCPSLCNDAGPDPSNWTHIHHLRELKTCHLPIIFDVNVQALVDDPQTILTIRACVSTGQETYNTKSLPPLQDDGSRVSHGNLTISNNCGGKTIKSSVTPGVDGSVSHPGSGAKPNATDVLTATRHLTLFLQKGSQCGTTIMFAKSNSAVVGLYSGAEVAQTSVSAMLSTFRDRVQPGGTAFQVCKTGKAALTFGVYAASFPDLGVAQAAVKGWTNGLCLNGSTPSAALDMDVLVSVISKNTTATPLHGNSTLGAKGPRSLQARADCKTQQVKSGDGCADLATRCGISSANLTKFNPQANFCSTLKPNQYYCCTAGTLPDMRPKPNPDGSCQSYKVAAGDGCFSIASSFGITQANIESFNKKTWGWAGCAHLQAGQLICLSTGDPPMPAAVADATCGPQVPGTKKPTDGTSLADLNPCPLNACCNVWGFCGTTDDFCVPSPADTGAPGTAKPGTNGCISHCGSDVVNNDETPASFKRIGYYEAFSYDRDCLAMHPRSIPKNNFTHVHFAFATVTDKFDVDISDYDIEFNAWKGGDYKKVLSFGGWDFSTGSDTFQRFRQATTSAYRGTFVNNLVNFMKRENIDGFDFDWEYPGAPDIPDVPPGSASEGDNYLNFLSLLRSRLSKDKSISIAIPASFWYLQSYPVKDMAKYVDYFIYMTYDLHGQWDVENKWAIPSCEGGNCLRSHVNKTETYNALAMLTKAGVKSTKIAVGVTSYGRSFRMADQNCSEPMCTFLGGKLDSKAYKGRCTGTAGYISNAEITEIINKHGNYSIVNTYIDGDSASNILEYGNNGAVDWVAYMDGGLKAERIKWIQLLNFAGSSDWAIDLETFATEDTGKGTDASGAPLYDDEDEDGDGTDYGCLEEDNPGTLEGIADVIDNFNERCLSYFTLETLYDMLIDTLSLFDENSHDYDDKFKYYEEWIKELVDPKLDDYMRFGDGPGNQFFTCHWEAGSRSGTDPCTGVPHFWELEESFSVEYELTDEEGFYDDVAATLGIDRDWIAWGDRGKNYDCAAMAEDMPRRPYGNGNMPVCHRIFRRRLNVPVKASDDDIVVANPKEMIESSWTNITALQETLLATIVDVALDIFQDATVQVPEFDAIVAFAMPVLQLAESIDSMKDIKDIGERVMEEKKRELIFKILTFVFMALPFVGEALGPLVGSATALARIALLVSEAGNTAVTIADIIKDPTSAPFAMLGLIVGAAGGGGKLSRTESLGEASKARGLMKAADLAKFPQRFRDRDALVQKISKKSVCSVL